jgi:hypothetical protein
MYRRNLDIAVATIVAILGGLAAAAHLPGAVTVPLGVGLFFAPGYLWSEGILSQRLSGLERTITSAGMALIFPILGGFLFYALGIPLLKPAWIGLLVVLTLLGVVAVAIQRLREAPVDERQQPQRRQPQHRPPPRQQPQRRPPEPQKSGLSVVHAGIFGLAAVIGIGSVAFSVKNAEAQKFPTVTQLYMTGIHPDAQSFVGNSQAAAGNPEANETTATQAHLGVTNNQGMPEQYTLKLYKKGKLSNTWNFTLDNNQTWQVTIPYTVDNDYKMLADLYMLPDLKTPYRWVDNGQ